MTIESPIPVIVNGAGGKMGREVIKHVTQSEDMVLIGAVDINPEYLGKDIGELAGIKTLEIPIGKYIDNSNPGKSARSYG